MAIFVHLLLFLVSAAIIWFFAGMLVESVNRVAHRFYLSGFTVAFFVLGFLTSISEISVMVNSTIDKAPQVSTGNLIGASFVILLCIVPLLAMAGNGIRLTNTLHKSSLALALAVVLLPVLLVLDGNVTRSEGLVCLLLYCLLVYRIRRQTSVTVPQVVKAVETNLLHKHVVTIIDTGKILLGASFIFIAGNLLVDESIYFSNILSIPSSIVGLLVLSIGTNIPEIVIAVRSLLKRHTDIAFGDYLGSTVANTLIFSFLPWLNGNFMVESTEFLFTAVLMVVGFIGFYIAAQSKNAISRVEGMGLMATYILFVIVQSITFIKFATD